ncbi:hypothetical protein FHG87_024551 [Trinorchestia longiramus]|nr:hypothetical protein FHG87_024551 [Trinorchestia longiramus]
MLPTNTACLSSSVESPSKRMRIDLPLTKIPISNYCDIPLKIPVNNPPRTLVQTSTEAQPKISVNTATEVSSRTPLKITSF